MSSVTFVRPSTRCDLRTSVTSYVFFHSLLLSYEQSSYSAMLKSIPGIPVTRLSLNTTISNEFPELLCLSRGILHWYMLGYGCGCVSADGSKGTPHNTHTTPHPATHPQVVERIGTRFIAEIGSKYQYLEPNRSFLLNDLYLKWQEKAGLGAHFTYVFENFFRRK